VLHIETCLLVFRLCWGFAPLNQPSVPSFQLPLAVLLSFLRGQLLVAWIKTEPNENRSFSFSEWIHFSMLRIESSVHTAL